MDKLRVKAKELLIRSTKSEETRRLMRFLDSVEPGRSVRTRESWSGWPSISIITPSYNQGEYLSEAIRSVAGQGYPKREHIVVDGGSDDDSQAVLKTWDRQLAWWISEPDRGQAHAINKGASRSKGTIQAWLNSDDVYLPGTLTHIARAFRENPGVDIVYGASFILNEDTEVVDFRFSSPLWGEGYRSGAVNIQQASVFWRRELFEETGGLNDTLEYAMDVDLWARFMKRGAVAFYYPRFFSGFRRQSRAKTVREPDRVGEEARRVLEEHFADETDLKPVRRVKKALYRLRALVYHIGCRPSVPR